MIFRKPSLSEYPENKLEAEIAMSRIMFSFCMRN